MSIRPEKLVYTLPEARDATGIDMDFLRTAIARGELLAREHDWLTIILTDDLKAYLTRLPISPFSRGEGMVDE